MAETLYVVYQNAVVAIAPGNVVSVLAGTIPGSDGVTLARNNRVTAGASTPDLVAVRESGGAYAISAFAVTPFPDADLPATVNSVDHMGGYGLFTVPDGRIVATQLNALDVDALSFAQAESRSDGLLRGIVHGGRFNAMGASTIEPWLNEGYSPFPLARATSIIPVGLLTTMAVAGFEDGWDRAPIFVAHDGTVRELAGYDTRVVSTSDVERFVADSTRSTLEACVFTFRGHAMWALSSDKGTWVYDASNETWAERVSAGLNRWRASRTIKSGDRWLAGDKLSSFVLAIDPEARIEAGLPLVRSIESAPAKESPLRAAIDALIADFTLGRGTVSVPNPQVAISWSHDGGTTWRGPIQRPLGVAGKAIGPVRVNGLGLASHHGFRARFAVADDVDFSFMGAAIPRPEPRAP